jgi:predicted NBD/HSP70 family sugar kinase
MDDGLIEESGRGPSTGGKAPILLRVRADGRHLIGLDLGESGFTGATVDLRGRIINSTSVALEGRDGDDAVQLVFSLIDGLASANGASPLLGIGIGAPGLIDPRTGTVRWSVTLDWTDLPLGPMVERRLGVPVVVANDSQAAAVGELTYGAGRRMDNLIVVRVGRGIGAGIILDGKLYHGDGSGAGEIGHSILGQTDDARLAPCRCGRVGCLETVASMPAVVAAAHRRNASVVDDDSLIAALRSGDEQVRRVVLEAGRMLGQGIAGLIGALNVNHVLLIGPATRLGDEWLDAVRRQAEHSALPILARNTRIELGVTRDDDVLIGVTALLMTEELGLSLAR